MLTRVFGNVLLLLFCASGLASHAQSLQQFREALSGQWVVFDPAYSVTSGQCTLLLQTNVEATGLLQEAQSRPAAQSQDCISPISTVSSWDIQQGQLALYSNTNALLARLGGNQLRITGDLENSFASIVLERVTGDPYQRKISQALEKYRCIFLGYTGECAEPDELSAPRTLADGGTVANIQSLVFLNVRDQPRRTANVSRTLEPEACLQVNFCTTASDGIWCRASFGETSGWVAKTALRQDEWPVTTFVAGCQ
ncbi:MAG: SH3 domain-containing protein [Dinoroseobacter sp.]|nr:SH3 domain-containing protein [Dinoroseobacter sp.]MDJ0992547.1 SH3 domain-containing protein [Dinoroseobacter sp.]